LPKTIIASKNPTQSSVKGLRPLFSRPLSDDEFLKKREEQIYKKALKSANLDPRNAPNPKLSPGAK